MPIFKNETNVLGHVVENVTIETNPDEIKSVKNYPRPTNAKKVKPFLGLTGYYCRFIKNYTK